MSKHINATSESGKRFFLNFQNKGKIVMLNLLKFKHKADYSNLESIDPQKGITGIEAYQLYMDSILPLLAAAGSRIIFYGNSDNFIIGPESEKWDAVLLVEHQSVNSFMEFSQSGEYLKSAGHRTAALEDSRLLPTIEK